jgi:hypothetical protein
VEREEWFVLGVEVVFDRVRGESRKDGLGELANRVDIGLTASASEPYMGLTQT